MEDYTVWTDGSCDYKNSVGGWAAVIRNNHSDKDTYLYGCAADTTTNRMEVHAAISAIRLLPKQSVIRVISDSTYALLSIKRSGWRNKAANKDLLILMAEAKQGKDVRTTWIRGHSGHPENELCHEMANKARQKLLTELHSYGRVK